MAKMKFRSPIRWSRLTLAVLSAVFASATTGFAQDPPPTPTVSPARAQIEQIIQQSHADVSVAFRSLDGKQQLFIKANEPFPAAASIIQIPVMMELYAQAQSGELRLTDAIVVHNSFRSLVDGTPFQLDSKTDPDRELYGQMGKPVSLRDLCEHMVAHNSSLAADLLIEKLGVDRIRERIAALHIDRMDLARAIEPAEANQKGPNNATTARSVLELLWTLAKRQESGDDSSKEMIGMLARAALQQPPTAGMPADPRDAQSLQVAGTGQQSMIVYGPHPYVVVILASGITNPVASAALMGQIENALTAGLEASLGGG